MKDKLEPNVYVRTKYGYIARLNKINKTDRYTEYEFDNKIGYDYDGFFHSIVEYCIDDIEIIKASHNIIDLIEPSDLMYIDISPDNYGGIVVPRVAETKAELEKWKERFASGECILKAILTKEQIINNWYEVSNNVKDKR